MDMVLKRRLIGASILIALAVIFVPMLLVDPDSVDDGAGDPVAVPPMPESAGDVRRIPLDPEAARVADRDQPRDPISAPRPAESSTPMPGDVEDGSEQQAEPSPPEHEIVLRPELSRSGGTDEAPPEETPTPRETSETETQPAETAEASSPPPEIEAGEPEPEVEPTVRLGDFVVQVASFGSEESANGVRQRLEALGHIVDRDEIVRGDTLLYRLRTGPYPTRAAAERALEQIAATVSGVEPIVREIDGDSGAAGEPGFVVQVGSFVGEDNAEAETGRLEGLGFEALRFSEQIGERLIWRVVVGPVDERSEADALQQRLADEAGVEGLVVSYP